MNELERKNRRGTDGRTITRSEQSSAYTQVKTRDDIYSCSRPVEPERSQLSNARRKCLANIHFQEAFYPGETEGTRALGFREPRNCNCRTTRWIERNRSVRREEYSRRSSREKCDNQATGRTRNARWSIWKVSKGSWPLSVIARISSGVYIYADVI